MREFQTMFFNELTIEQLYDILYARAKIFVGEQQILYPDVDGVDRECVHVFCYGDDEIAAYLRMFPKHDEPSTVHIGRVLTVDRRSGVGRDLMLAGMRAAEAMLGAKEIYLDSQKHAEGFYLKLGFRTVSEEFLEAGIPHVAMRYEFG